MRLKPVIKNGNYDHNLIRNFKYAFLIKLITRNNVIFDVRTVSVSKNPIQRLLYNAIIKFNTLFFYRIFCISPAIVDDLKLDKKKVWIVPLGASNNIEKRSDNISNMKLLYVGTFNGRNIYETIEGLSIFCHNNPTVKVAYTIVGAGNEAETTKIISAIKKTPENLSVKKIGYVPNHELDNYLRDNNIGVSYVPVKKWYLPQPVTKTYEYLLAGMVVIATSLPANIEAINDNNGVFVDDNANSFAEGIAKIYENLEHYNPNAIIKKSLKYHWKVIINNRLIKALESDT